MAERAQEAGAAGPADEHALEVATLLGRRRGVTRILVAKPGLDGHDRGAKLVARGLRDAGFEVIYTGIRQRPDAIAAVALQEDVDIVGLSILSGAHVALTKKTAEALRAAGADDVVLVVGGTIPKQDIPRLQEAGATAVYPTGTPLETVVESVRSLSSS
jgi:methylmalonyl-CoA mutase C-terminal domain/subunit